MDSFSTAAWQNIDKMNEWRERLELADETVKWYKHLNRITLGAYEHELTIAELVIEQLHNERRFWNLDD